MSIASIVTKGFIGNIIPARGFISGGASSDILLGGGPGGYTHKIHKSYDELREEEYQREIVEQRRLELQKVNEEIALAEQAKEKRLAKLATKNAAKKLEALERKLEDEINGLRIERVRLMRFIDDEEAILILLLSLPFH